MVIKAKVTGKFIENENCRLELEFLDYYNIHTGSSIDRVRVSEVAYNKLGIGDLVLCPMLKEVEGLVYDYDSLLQKV